ncbi:trypsin-like peptidase domain-containing protein [Staphylococcus pettenkoferi]|uniref:trypsin-like peptidase domain-containing protein n=1 Tax=Staphylococcus pettenkoferi TaxID=170573 RepID=UPI0022742746|nr:trypsin-like peptidase domain-containing protein [Staphylococcus pettenkoferi]MCY1585159.1 trypsin-like peptidase domain-containing protein [Staphylococcus pettenkoferi]
MNLKKYVISLIVTLACGLGIGAGHASAEEIQQQDNQQDVATHQTATAQVDQSEKSQQATPETKSSQVGEYQQATEEDSAQDTSSHADADKAQSQDVATTEEQKSAQQDQATATQSKQPQTSQDVPQQDHKAIHTDHTATQDQASQVNNKQQPQQKQAPQNNQTQQPQQQDKAQQQAPQAQQDKQQQQQKAATAATQEPKQEQPAANNEQPRNAQIPEGHFQNEIILPNNNRHRIPGTTHGHYQSLCFVDMGDGGIASGVVVGENTMLTNKHVVKNDSLTAMPAANGQNNFPKGQFKSNNIVRYPGDQDLAVVHFDKNDKGQSIGDVVRPANMADAQQSKVGERMTITGYPGDKPLSTMWESIGKITKNDGSHLEYDASTVGGNSGSGVFNKKRQLIGIHYGGAGKDANGSVPLTGDMLNFVKNNMK